MSSRYFYKGTNIADLIETTGNTTNSFGFNNFPQQNTGQTYISKINKPFDFMYTKNGEDISNSCNAYFLEYTNQADFPSGQGNTTNIRQSMKINNVGFKHISAYAWGGGGGGGGGGGAHGWWTKNGGTGRDGGTGGYAAVTNFIANTSEIIVQAGRGGSLGNRGVKTNLEFENAPDGQGGGKGVASYIALSDGTKIIEAEGGNGGDGGNGGNDANNGSGGASTGNTGDSTGLVVDDSTVANYTDNGQYVYSKPVDATVWPTQNSGNNGNNGNGASWNGPASNDGNVGRVGYVGIYFLYK